MTGLRMKMIRRDARWTGYSLLVGCWLALTGATLGIEIPIDGVPLFIVTVIGTGLILWGSFKTRVEKVEEAQAQMRVEIANRLSREVFEQFHTDLVKRLDRIEGNQDRREERDRQAEL